VCLTGCPFCLAWDLPTYLLVNGLACPLRLCSKLMGCDTAPGRVVERGAGCCVAEDACFVARPYWMRVICTMGRSLTVRRPMDCFVFLSFFHGVHGGAMVKVVGIKDVLSNQPVKKGAGSLSDQLIWEGSEEPRRLGRYEVTCRTYPSACMHMCVYLRDRKAWGRRISCLPDLGDNAHCR